jgi:hypothetical protein
MKIESRQPKTFHLGIYIGWHRAQLRVLKSYTRRRGSIVVCDEAHNLLHVIRRGSDSECIIPVNQNTPIQRNGKKSG